MDNNSVEMQAKENNPKKNGRIAVCCCIVAAICIVVATVLVMHFRNSDGAAITGTDTTESESNSDQSQDNETEAETEAPKPEFEISEAGVLTAYNGDDETVVIPDNVISIGEDAFGTSPYADEIKTVKLGKSVEDIDVQAFVSLTKLENVEVPEENSNFISGDGVLIKTDNSVFFCMPSIIKDDYDMFDVFFDVISDDENSYGTAQVILKGMMATVNVTEAEEGLINFGIKHNVYCTSFYANGHNFYFNEPLAYISDFSRSKMIRAYETDEGVLFSNTSGYGFGDTWILLKDNVLYTKIVVPNYEEKIGNEEWYNYSVIRFYKEDGLLKYKRIPYKYIFDGTYSDIIWNCTGFDEFAGEIGTVKIENNELKYCPEISWTVRDDMVGRFLEETYDPELQGYATLEEYLEHNAEIYEKSK